MKITHSFLILVLIVSLTHQQNPTFKNYPIEDFAGDFNWEICGKCGDEKCAKNVKILQKMTNLDLGINSITNNSKKIDSVRIWTDKITNNYTIGDKDYINITTGYLTAAPVVKNSYDYMGHIAYYHPTIFNKQLVPSNFAIHSNTAKSYRSLIAFWCSLGYSITFYDGVGLGIDWKRIHPYVLVPWPNIQNMYFILNYFVSILQ